MTPVTIKRSQAGSYHVFRDSTHVAKIWNVRGTFSGKGWMLIDVRRQIASRWFVTLADAKAAAITQYREVQS